MKLEYIMTEGKGSYSRPNRTNAKITVTAQKGSFCFTFRENSWNVFHDLKVLPKLIEDKVYFIPEGKAKQVDETARAFKLCHNYRENDDVRRFTISRNIEENKAFSYFVGDYSALNYDPESDLFFIQKPYGRTK